MGRNALLFGLGIGAAACIACTAILGDFEPTAGTGTPDGGDSGGGTDATTDSAAEAGPLAGFHATFVSAGEHHTCAVRAGRVYCWGRDLKGQLGQDPSSYPTGASKPTLISGLGQAGGTKGIIAVAGGYNHTCALDGEGSVFCWGQNDRGQLGNTGATIDGNPHFLQLQVQGVGGTGFLQNVIAISAGEAHTCAVTTSTIMCWGDNTFGQVGVNPALQGQFSTPHDIGGTFNGPKTVTAGPKHTCASNGTAFTCWGTQAAGELGLNADGGPAIVVIAGSTQTNTVAGGIIGAIAAGEQHTCAQTGNGGVFGAACWGDNTFGQVGSLDAGRYFVPTAVSGLGNVDSVVTGASYSCALLKDKSVACWGKNDVGQLGAGVMLPGATMNPAPTPVASLANVTSLSAGFDHACAVVGGSTTNPGQVFCWGAGANNQLGIGASLDDQTTPKLVDPD